MTANPMAFRYRDSRGRTQHADALQFWFKLVQIAPAADWIRICTTIHDCTQDPDVMHARAEEFASAWRFALTAARRLFRLRPIHPRTGEGTTDAQAVDVLAKLLAFVLNAAVDYQAQVEGQEQPDAASATRSPEP